MSQLFDALRRERGDAPVVAGHVERTARADAVLATLGYGRKRRVSPVHQLAVVGVAGLVVAFAVAWALWPDEAPRVRPVLASSGSPGSPGSKDPGATLESAKNPGATSGSVPSSATTPSSIAKATTQEPLSPEPEDPGPTSGRATPGAVAAAPLSAPPAPPVAATAKPARVTSAEELFRRALYHHRSGDLVAAESDYRALLARNELDPQVHNNLGLLYRDKGQLGDSIREFQRALVIHPEYGTARNNLGVVLMGAARLDEAATEFRRVLAEDPRNADAAVNLALVDKAGGRPELAKESLLRALTIDPDNAPAHFNLAALYEQSGDDARAIEHYRRFLASAGAEHASRTPDARARLEALARPR